MDRASFQHNRQPMTANLSGLDQGQGVGVDGRARPAAYQLPVLDPESVSVQQVNCSGPDCELMAQEDTRHTRSRRRPRRRPTADIVEGPVGVVDGVAASSAASRVAGLLAVAILPLLAGLALSRTGQLGGGYGAAMLISAGLCVARPGSLL